MILSLEEIRPQIYHLHLADRYQCCMSFLRYAEYYESPRWHDQNFTIIEYMDWYAHEYYSDGQTFSYPADWAGFNIPSKVFDILLPHGSKSPTIDWNSYDAFMFGIVTEIRRLTNDKPWYLIGTAGDQSALSHEIAHGYWSNDFKYKKEQLAVLQNHKGVVKKLKNMLLKDGYAKHVLSDECHAYLSTGASPDLEELFKTPNAKKAIKETTAIFKKKDKAVCKSMQQ